MWRGSMAKSSSAGLSALGARVWNWCDERLALSSIWAIAEKKTTSREIIVEARISNRRIGKSNQ